MTGCGKYKDAHGKIYKGNFECGYLEGWGSCEWPDGRVFEGVFEGGCLDGEGRCRWPDGRVYDGEFDFESGQLNGDGQHEWPNGDVYQGQFVRGQRTGKGSYRWSNGTAYEGDFVNGEMTGKGKLKMPSGEVCEGDFVNGQFRGNAQREPQAVSDRGEWRDKPHVVLSKPTLPQEPHLQPRSTPTLRDSGHGKFPGEAAARQRGTEDSAGTAAEDLRRRQELEAQASRHQAENDARNRRQQEIAARYTTLLKDRFPFTIGGKVWLWFLPIFYAVFFVGTIIGRFLFEVRGDEFFGGALLLSLGVTPLVLWRIREKRRKSRKYAAIIAKRDAELREVS